MNRFTTTFLLVAMAATAQHAATQDTLATKRDHGASGAVVVSMNFPGGTMAEFVAALRSKHPKANVMLATRARSVTLPATILKEAGLAQTLEGACMSAAGEYDVRVREFSGNGQPVYSITAHEKRRSSARKPANVYPRKIPSVYSLSELTMQRRSNVAPFSVKTIMSAIDLAMSHLDTPPRMKFHEDSGLLLISGSAEHTHIVEETLAALRRDLQTREKSGTRRAQPQKGGK